MRRILHWIFGGALLRAGRCETEKILNFCMKYRLVYRNLQQTGDYVFLECTLYTASMLLDVCRQEGVKIEAVKKFGIPVMIYRYRKRAGAAAGFLIAMTIIFMSNRFLWDVRITGAENIGEESVISQLRDKNFYIGTYLPAVDVDQIENRLLIDSENIAWISINLKGCVAYVEVREKELEPEKKSDAPANLVALRDGQVESISVAQGLVLVKKGEHVRKGQLLVSGIYDSRVLGYRYVRASGEILAKTVRTLRVEIPYNYEVKRYSGEEIKRTTLFFFSKEIKLYGNTGFLDGTYDTIFKVENYSLFDGTRLPITNQTTVYKYFYTETLRRSESEAVDLAYAELDRQIDEILSEGALLLRKNVTWSATDEAVILDCTINLIENIAGISEIDILNTEIK